MSRRKVWHPHSSGCQSLWPMEKSGWGVFRFRSFLRGELLTEHVERRGSAVGAMPQVLGHLGSRRLAIAMQAVPFIRAFMIEWVHRTTVSIRLRRVPRPVTRDFRSNLPCFPFGDGKRLGHKVRILDRVILEAPIGDQQLRFAGGRLSDEDTPAAPHHQTSSIAPGPVIIWKIAPQSSESTVGDHTISQTIHAPPESNDDHSLRQEY